MREEIADGMSVSGVSDLLGVPVATLRSWERRYTFPRPDRTKGLHRRYTREDIEKLRMLRDLIASGLPASEATDVARQAMSGRAGELARSIVDAGLDYDTPAIRVSLERAVAELGMDQTIETVVLPVLRQVGSLWEAGRCDVSQEHVTSHQIRSWLSGRLQVSRRRVRAKPIVLACGPKDLHTIGLEAFYVMLTMRGIECRLLGELTPPDALVTAARLTDPAAIVLVSHLSSHRAAAVDSLRGVAKAVDTEIFYAGNAFNSARSRRGVPGRYLGRKLVPAADLVRSVAVQAASTGTNDRSEDALTNIGG